MRVALLLLLFTFCATATAAAYDCSPATYRSASAKIQSLFAMGMLANDPQRGASVLVAEDFWRTLSYPEKVRFAEAFSYAIAGEGKGLSHWRFRSLSTGREIGSWSMGTLIVR